MRALRYVCHVRQENTTEKLEQRQKMHADYVLLGRTQLETEVASVMRAPGSRV